ncbi:hypothetical protein JVU11DRAFT_4378 [Chiua virens]|nr:hypothetical protein JVU11DRAFT_4378 [Chiua virens]
MADCQPTKAGAPKTRAKARYLKRKLLRRKARKASAPQKSRDAFQPSPGSGEDQEGYDEEERVGDEEKGIAMEEPIQPPKKRQKLAQQRPEPDIGDAGTMPESENEEPLSIQRNLANPTGTLPSFPAPTVPSAPPKSVLAMQGIDKALVHAELISPAVVKPLSTTELDQETGLSLKTRRRLFELGITGLFAVQTTLLPFLILQNRSLYAPYLAPHDICVSAPTGSGKTLAYVLPILELLSTRIVTRLRALIVLPTRDLVIQVRETFEAVGKGRGLKIGTVTGQHSFAHEQAQLISETDSSLLGGSSKVDILICTPGRLMDHLNGTPNFSLQHLRFLIIDEADRLLSQSFQDWLAQVLAAISWRPSERISLGGALASEDTYLPANCDSLAPACLDFWRHGFRQVDVSERRGLSCQKLLFSATLTRDPGKLASLGLRDPKYFIVQNQTEGGSEGAPSHVVSERFTMPNTLTEHMVICDPSQKPLLLFHLLHSYNVRNALIFTKSSESTARLVFLLECFEELRTSRSARVTVRAYSSDLPAGERKTILEKFKSQEVHVIFSVKNPNPPPPKSSIYDAILTPEASAGFFNRLWFTWLTPLLSLGYARPLEASDLYKLPDERSATRIANAILTSFEHRRQEAVLYNEQLANGRAGLGVRGLWWSVRGVRAEREKAWRERDGKRKASLILAMNDSVKWLLWSAGILKVIGDTAQVTSPLVVKAIITFATESYTAHLAGTPTPPIGTGIGLAFALLILQLISSWCTQHFFYRSMACGVLLRGGLITAIYSRALSLSPRARVQMTNGRLVNHISTDVSRIDFCAGYFHMCWAAPIQLAICLVLLLINLGPSALAGFALLVLATPINTVVMKRFFSLRIKSMVWTDKRSKLLQEMLSGMRVIKFFSWETPFLKRIAEYRQFEMAYIRALLVLRAGLNAFAFSLPALATVLAFVTYTLTGHSLSAANVFSSLTLFQLIRLPLMFLPMSLSSIADAATACKRLYEVFEAETTDRTLAINKDLDPAVK